jgi:hypothetical protein
MNSPQGCSSERAADGRSASTRGVFVKAGRPSDANFAYGGRVTEIALLGNIAIHHKGQRLDFNPKTERFTNSDSANRMFDRPVRDGWALPV